MSQEEWGALLNSSEPPLTAEEQAFEEAMFIARAYEDEARCPTCQGSGEIECETGMHTCTRCDGEGR